VVLSIALSTVGDKRLHDGDRHAFPQALDEWGIWKQFYVASDGRDSNPGSIDRPFASLSRARQAVRSLPRPWAGDVFISLRAGTYWLDSTLELNQSDSGMDGNRVFYQPYLYGTPSQESVSLSGGWPVTGWSDSDEDGTFEAEAPSFDFRQLYVNDRRATRARTPNADSPYARVVAWDATNPQGGSVPGGGKLVLTESDMAMLGELSTAELQGVEVVVQKNWNQANLRVHNLETEGARSWVVPFEPERSRNFQLAYPTRLDDQWYHLENARAFLDSPGEWFLDTTSSPRKIYYRPRAGEDMSTAVVSVPRIETLLKLSGTLDTPVQNLTFRGLTFQNTTWTMPSRAGYVGVQASVDSRGDSWGRMPAAIHVQGATNNVFERNVIKHAGANGLSLYSATDSNAIVGNAVVDVMGSGILIDEQLEPSMDDPRETARNDVVGDNYITRVGQEYRGAVGVFVGYSDGVRVEDNELHDLPYTGISFGWGWSTTPTVARKGRIIGNHVYDVAKLMIDSGCIYTLSAQGTGLEDGLLIADNYCHDISRVEGKPDFTLGGIYLDDGSSFVSLRDNVIERTAQRFATNEPGSMASFENSDGSDNRVSNPSNAASIIKQAGPQPAYVGIKSSSALPPPEAGSLASIAPPADVETNEPDVVEQGDSGNLVSGGSFEDDANGDRYPDRWLERSSGPTRASHHDATERSSGAASLRVDVSPGAAYAEQTLQLKPGTSYTLSAQAKTRSVVGGPGVWLRYAEIQPSVRVHNTAELHGSNDWTRLSATFTTSSSYEAGRLDVIWQAESGTIWVDDVSLCEGNVDCSTLAAVDRVPTPDAAVNATVAADDLAGTGPIGAGVPPDRVTDYSLGVEQWWSGHSMNPDSPTFIGRIPTPEPRVDVLNEFRGDIQAAIDACPPPGCTLYLRNGDYPDRWIIQARDNIHLVGESRDGVRVRGGAILGCADSRNFTQFSKDIFDGNASAIACANKRANNFSFFNLTFDGNNEPTRYDAPEHWLYGNAVFLRTVRDVVFDSVTIRNYTDPRGNHHGLISGNYLLDNVWVRNSRVECCGRFALFVDGCHGCGYLNNQIGQFDSGALCAFTNQDATHDLDGNGQIDEYEERQSRYIVVSGNTIAHNNASAVLIQGNNALVKDNRTTGFHSWFVLIESRASLTYPQVVHDVLGHRVRDNQIHQALNVVRVNVNDGCDHTPHAPFGCQRVGQMEVTGNRIGTADRFQQLVRLDGNWPVDQPMDTTNNRLADRLIAP
jgi:hypothetical protein